MERTCPSGLVRNWSTCFISKSSEKSNFIMNIMSKNVNKSCLPLEMIFLEQPVVALQFSSSQLSAGALCTSTLRRLESHRELFFFPVYLTCSAVSAHYGHYELLLLIMLLGRWHLDLLNWCWRGWKNLSSQIQIFFYDQKGELKMVEMRGRKRGIVRNTTLSDQNQWHQTTSTIQCHVYTALLHSPPSVCLSNRL